MTTKPAPPANPDSSPPETPAPNPLTVALEAAKSDPEIITKIRERADLGAKAFAGLATSAVTAIGIDKFSDVFPWPGTPEGTWAAAAVFGGFLAIVASIAFFAWKLWRVGEPITMRTDIDAIDFRDDDDKERAIVTAVYEEMAKLNGAPSLMVLEARGHRLAHVADRLGDAGGTAAQEAHDIQAGIYATYGRAAVLLTRRRASRVVSSFGFAFFFGLFAVGFMCFGIGADYLQSERTDRLAVAKACAEARKGEAKDLPTICGPEDESPSPSPTATPDLEAVNSSALEQAAAALGECRKVAREVDAPKGSCLRLQNAVEALTPGS